MEGVRECFVLGAGQQQQRGFTSLCDAPRYLVSIADRARVIDVSFTFSRSLSLLQASMFASSRPLFLQTSCSKSRDSLCRTQSTLSAVHRGVAFEERALSALSELSMSLRRVGGRNDGGIDLQGWWWIPSDISAEQRNVGEEHANGRRRIGIDPSGQRRTRIRVLAQCKAERKKLGPSYVRELEGVLHRYIASTSSASVSIPSAEEESATLGTGGALVPAIALLVSQSAFTKAAILSAFSSPLPLLLVHLPPLPASMDSSLQTDVNPEADLDSGSIGSAVWNPALGGLKGLLGNKMELRWENSPTVRGNQGAAGRPILWCGGSRLESWVQPLTDSSDL